VGRGVRSARSRSPHQSRDIPAAGRREAADWSSSNPASRERDAHGERERQQCDRRDVTAPSSHYETATTTTSNNVRLTHAESSQSESSDGE